MDNLSYALALFRTCSAYEVAHHLSPHKPWRLFVCRKSEIQNICSPKKHHYRKVLEPLGKPTESHLTFKVTTVESSIKSDVRPYTTIMQNNIPMTTFCWEMPGALCARDNGSGEPLVLDQLGVAAGIPRRTRPEDWGQGVGTWYLLPSKGLNLPLGSVRKSPTLNADCLLGMGGGGGSTGLLFLGKTMTYRVWVSGSVWIALYLISSHSIWNCGFCRSELVKYCHFGMVQTTTLQILPPYRF